MRTIVLLLIVMFGTVAFAQAPRPTYWVPAAPGTADAGCSTTVWPDNYIDASDGTSWRCNPEDDLWDHFTRITNPTTDELVFGDRASISNDQAAFSIDTEGTFGNAWKNLAVYFDQVSGSNDANVAYTFGTPEFKIETAGEGCQSSGDNDVPGHCEQLVIQPGNVLIGDPENSTTLLVYGLINAIGGGIYQGTGLNVCRDGNGTALYINDQENCAGTLYSVDIVSGRAEVTFYNTSHAADVQLQYTAANELTIDGDVVIESPHELTVDAINVGAFSPDSLYVGGTAGVSTTYSGTHDGGDAVGDVADSTADFVTIDTLIGRFLHNVDDASGCYIETNDDTSADCTLVADDGTCDTEDCLWYDGDDYTITIPTGAAMADDVIWLKNQNKGTGCETGQEGYVYYNSDYGLCYCNGSDWRRVVNDSDCHA